MVAAERHGAAHYSAQRRIREQSSPNTAGSGALSPAGFFSMTSTTRQKGAKTTKQGSPSTPPSAAQRFQCGEGHCVDATKLIKHQSGPLNP